MDPAQPAKRSVGVSRTSGRPPVVPGPRVRTEDAVPVVVESKLSPPVLAVPSVRRSRLLRTLSAGVGRTPVILLSGPAGSGKTMLAASWWRAQPAGAPRAWLTLDPKDDEPATFWSHVTAGLAGTGVDPADLPPLVAGERPPRGYLPALAARLLTAAEPVVLVLDGADVLTDRGLLTDLELLITHAGTRLRLVLCARADPLLPLHRYRAAGQLTEIRAAELAFTAAETAELLATSGTPVSEPIAAALTEQTQGWAAGLRLATAPLREGRDPQQLVTALAADDGGVVQYLTAEILDAQPVKVRRFLLRVSVTEQLWPELVEKLTGRTDARRLLATLARANAFIDPAPAAPGGYRIHRLFRTFLQAQAAWELPEELPGLHRACAAFYATAGQAELAAEHALAAGDWPTAATLLVDANAAGRLLAHEPSAAAAVLPCPPAELPGPDAAVLRAAQAVAAGRPPNTSDLSELAAAAADLTARPVLRASAAVLAAVGRAEAPGDDGPGPPLLGEPAAHLVAALPAEQARERADLAAALAGAHARVVLRGDALEEDLRAALLGAARAARAAQSRRLLAAADARLALLEALSGRLTRALDMAVDAHRRTAARGLSAAEGEPSAALAAAWACTARYDLPEARRWLGVAQQQLDDGEPAAPLLAVLRARHHRARHDHRAAEEVLRPYVADPRVPRWVRERVLLEAATVRLDAGRSATVPDLLAPLEDSPRATVLRAGAWPANTDHRRQVVLASESAAATDLAVDAELLAACQAAESGDVPAAISLLQQALDRAAPEQLRWPFLHAPEIARRLMRTHPVLATAASWLHQHDAAAIPSPRMPTGRTASGPVTPLSRRELEVLRHLAEMLSTAEIAAAMFVSINTVRTHIRSILRKLDVTGRNQAIRRARDLGLL